MTRGQKESGDLCGGGTEEEHTHQLQHSIGVFTAAEKERLMRHLTLEEERERHSTEKLDAGERRMERIEEDLRPLKALYYAVLGSGTVAGLLLTSLLYIYQADKADFKSMQEVLYKQGTVLEKLLQSHANLEGSVSKLDQRLEKEIDRSNGRHR
jgi:PHD/YefM family antitoxin component YafN of YafNO toxin-antitoxin module